MTPGPLVSIVDKYGERGAGSSFTTIEGKNIQRYNSGWKEAIRAVNERIHQDLKYKSAAIFKVFSNELTTYHSKFVQLLQGVSHSCHVPPRPRTRRRSFLSRPWGTSC